MQLRGNLAADLHRLRGGSSVPLLILACLTNRPFRAVATLRLCRCADRSGLGRLARIPAQVLHRVACQLAGVDLPWRTDIGPGFVLNHGWGVVVTPGARIGSNVTVLQGVTIGERDRTNADGERVSGFPVLEDDVWVGPNAVIVGAVTVGKGARVGPAAVVLDDVAPRATVVAPASTTLYPRPSSPDAVPSAAPQARQ